MKMLKLNKVLDPITDNGIFATLKNLYPEEFPFLTNDNVKTLDIEYYLGHSSEKYISRMYSNFIEKEESGAIVSAMAEMAKIVKEFYSLNWNRIHDALTAEYNPIENYNSHEVENVKSKVKSTSKSNAGVYGFNSTDVVPSSEQGIESVTEGAKDDNERELSRHGNIGVTSNQDMILQELKLREYSFFIRCMNDIDKVMCLKCY